MYFPHFRPFARVKQENIRDKTDLSSYLLAPIKRLAQYTLLLKAIDKELKKQNLHSACIEAAMEMVEKSISLANDYVAIASIKHCPLPLKEVAGSFIVRNKFNIIHPNSHFNKGPDKKQGFESMVFLFDKMIIFTLELEIKV